MYPTNTKDHHSETDYEMEKDHLLPDPDPDPDPEDEDFDEYEKYHIKKGKENRKKLKNKKRFRNNEWEE